MLVFGLCFTYFPMHNMMSIILLSLALLVWMHVSHISGWCAHAYYIHNNISLYKIEDKQYS